MRSFFSYVLMCALVGGAMVTAEKAKTAEDLQKSMKKIGPAQQAVNKAIQAMAYADANLKKKDDATKFTQETVAKIDALDKLLDGKSPDQTAITTAYREVGASCASCHRVYRSTDENNQFIIKPGTVS
jgi:cytochrome c556